MPAHIRKSDSKEQSVKEHLTAVETLAKQNATKIGMPQTASLAAILHDMGKCTKKFENYIYTLQL